MIHAPADTFTADSEFLDAVENDLRVAIAAGARPQLVARIQRLMPEIVEKTAPAAPALDPVTVTAVLSICRQLASFRLLGGQHEAIARLRAWCVAVLEGTK